MVISFFLFNFDCVKASSTISDMNGPSLHYEVLLQNKMVTNSFLNQLIVIIITSVITVPKGNSSWYIERLNIIFLLQEILSSIETIRK